MASCLLRTAEAAESAKHAARCGWHYLIKCLLPAVCCQDVGLQHIACPAVVRLLCTVSNVAIDLTVRCMCSSTGQVEFVAFNRNGRSASLHRHVPVQPFT